MNELVELVHNTRKVMAEHFEVESLSSYLAFLERIHIFNITNFKKYLYIRR